MDKSKKAFAASKYFKQSEFGPLGYLVEPELIVSLDALREALGVPLTITSGVRPLVDGEPVNHAKGLAADFRWPVKAGKRIAASVVKAAMLKAGFRGIGVYPWGFHGDIRGKPGDRVYTWGREYDEEGKALPDLGFAAFVSKYGEYGGKA